LYTRNYPAVYSTLSNPTWSADVIPLRDRVQEDFKQSTFQLLSRAYKSISPASAAFYLGLETADQDTIKLLVAQGWKYDEASGLLCPSVKFDNEVLRSAQKDERIGRLTSLVTHLTEV
jgi:COP9 signalosome complex subunit 8